MAKDHSEDFFSPPLWRQRRGFILDHLLRFKPSKVLDYGCGEASVLSFLIPPSDPPILHITGIDLDKDVLQEAIENCVPWECDYRWKRTHPLNIDIYHGSIAEIDNRFEGYDAIICSEVIEHVYNDVLDSFFSATLGHYQPNVLIVTTPNGEYNVNFPDLKYGTSESTFRHDDHKFEWTRHQFEEWCHQGASKYGYSVKFYGIGILNNKEYDPAHGHCTQACIFIRTAANAKKTTIRAGQPHTLLKHIEFPFYDDPPLEEQDMVKEVETYIEKLCIAEDYYRQQSVNSAKLPTPPPTDEEEEDEMKKEKKESLEWCLDWDNADHDDSDTMLSNPPVHYTTTPIQFPVTCLWDILRLRQICRTKQRLLHILQHSYDPKHYEVVGDDLVIKRSFAIANDTQSTHDDHSSSDDEV
ncbi:S-adenosyl-L-methionine-dependent methyltransferase [Backusella circina FSU 941]|nr:S-adenosyl-L-methionine-dependent methyltransferase [Backusella circina FSU 941]